MKMKKWIILKMMMYQGQVLDQTPMKVSFYYLIELNLLGNSVP